MRTLFVILSLTVVGGEPSDKDKLQGKWKVTVSKTGNPETEKLFLGTLVQFDGDTFQHVREGTKENSGTFKLDPEKKPCSIPMARRPIFRCSEFTPSKATS